MDLENFIADMAISFVWIGSTRRFFKCKNGVCQHLELYLLLTKVDPVRIIHQVLGKLIGVTLLSSGREVLTLLEAVNMPLIDRLI